MSISSSKDLVAQASGATRRLSPEEAARLAGQPNVVFVDVREQAELDKTGTIKGAVHVPRGLLEFKADPEIPTHAPELVSGKQLVVFCASGGRAALAAKTLKEMGVANVSHVQPGGFDALRNAGAPVIGGAG